jgi:kynurenine formamidase
MPTFIDLSHAVEDGVSSYRGLPGPVICDFWTREFSAQFYEEGTSFQIGKIEMVANTGTYLDTPFHRYADGKDLADLRLEQLAGLPALRVSVPYETKLAIDEAPFRGLDVAGKAVLVHTGWDVFWKSDRYYTGHPFLTAGAARYLLENGARLVGIDSHNIDDVSGKSRPVHSLLLANEVLIVEHLCNLSALPDGPFLFTAAPPKVKGMGKFPVRAFATLPEP